MVKTLAIALMAGLVGATPLHTNVDLFAVTWAGEVYVAGSGDDCSAAFKGAVIPADWRLLTCLRSEAYK